MQKLDTREQQCRAWLRQQMPTLSIQLQPLAGDASFRRYFRLHTDQNTYVVMDAPPTHESCENFVALARAFAVNAINVPDIYALNLQQGFVLMSDFGDRLYLNELNAHTVEDLYHVAFTELIKISQCESFHDYLLPVFDENLFYKELNLFLEWYLVRHLGMKLSATEQSLVEGIFSQLVNEALSQPKVCVHRDYHSRNLLVLNDTKNIGVLDFQDAVRGPITYDLMSLLRDCYIDWPYAQVVKWVERYRQLALQAGLSGVASEQQFLRQFDWMTLQRNLKCLGIFARLSYRDGKTQYLKAIPRIVGYAKCVCEKYESLFAFGEFLQRIELLQGKS